MQRSFEDIILVAMETMFCGKEVHHQCILSQESFMTNMNSIGLKANELLRFQSGYHEDLGTIATRYGDDAYCLRTPWYKI